MKIYILPVIILTLITLYLAGPEIDKEMKMPQLPEITDPQKYIGESEAGIHDMRPGNSKKIVWAEKEGEKTEYSIIYIHGFTASRSETAPLTEIIAEKTGANVFYTRLKGHGRYELRSQENVNISDWLEDTEEALEIGKMIGEKVLVVSCSTGTALATWLMEKHPDDIEATVMISPNFEPADRRIFILSYKWGPALSKLMEGEIIGEKEHIISPEHANNWSYIYRTDMVFPVVALLEYVKSVDFSEIDVPVIMFYSSRDKIVNQKKTLDVFEEWGTEKKKITEIMNPGDKNCHVIAGDIFSPETTDFAVHEIIEFLRQYGIIPENN